MPQHKARAIQQLVSVDDKLCTGADVRNMAELEREGKCPDRFAIWCKGTVLNVGEHEQILFCLDCRYIKLSTTKSLKG
jgi:hypothetical protein